MAPRGYGSRYRGRDPLWKKLVAAVLVLVILAALGAIYLQSHLVYDDRGVMHLELPWGTPEEPAEDPAASQSVPPDEPLNITVEDIDKTPKEQFRAVQLSSAPLTGEESLPEGADAVAVTLKDAEGHVFYDSLTAKAVHEKKIVRAEDATAGALAALTEGCPYTVARLSCLLDPIASRERLEEMGLKNTGTYVFYDRHSNTWLDPCKEETAAYLSGLAKECAALGFDEILLTDVSYPTEGKLNRIDYGPADDTEAGRSEALCALVSAVKAALAEAYPKVKVSVELPLQVALSGVDEISGQTMAGLGGLAYRVYVPCTPAEAPTLAEMVAGTRAEGSATPYFVPELSGGVEPGELEAYLRLPTE